MKTKLVIVFLVFMFLILYACRSLLNQRASWDFLQQSDFNIELPYKNNNEYYIPISYDVGKYNSVSLSVIKSKIKISDDEMKNPALKGGVSSFYKEIADFQSDCTVGFTTDISAMKQQFSRPKGLVALRYGIKPHCE